MAALASLPDELDWLLSFLAPSDELPALDLVCAEDEEALAAAAALLRASARRLEGRQEPLDFTRLDAARDAVAQALVRRLPELPADTPEGEAPKALESPFRIRAVTYSARQVAGYALLATGAEAPELDRSDVAHPRTARAALETTEQLALEHASPRSVWFQNSVRGAAGLAIGVFIAQRTGLQHGFWVVLGTLSVLRSNALGTGWSVVSALAGTAVGIVIGALLVIAIGTHEAVLWAVLPVAILLAAYAPRAISFAAGQAGFTVVLFVLFNIIQPVGWRVGVVRVEDVAIGFAISLGVGLLFWPRGAGALLRADLAAAYIRGADYVLATTQQLIDGRGSEEAARAARSADAALHRLDDAFRQYLTERSAGAYDMEDVGALVGGASRVRRAALSLSTLGLMADGGTRLQSCGENLERELHALQSWYVTLGYSLENGRPVPPPHIRDAEGTSRLLACIRRAAAGRDKETVKAALMLLWASQHLDNLWRLEAHLGERARASTPSPETGRLRRVRLLLGSGGLVQRDRPVDRLGTDGRSRRGPDEGDHDQRAGKQQPDEHVERRSEAVVERGAVRDAEPRVGAQVAVRRRRRDRAHGGDAHRAADLAAGVDQARRDPGVGALHAGQARDRHGDEREAHAGAAEHEGREESQK